MNCLAAVSLLQIITILTVCSGLQPETSSPYTNITDIPEFDMECHSDGECSLLLESTCKTDPSHDEKRCLCGDMTKPRGKGSCRHSKKGIGADCYEDEHCIEGAVCKRGEVPGFPDDYTSCQCMECYPQKNHLCVWTESDLCPVVKATASELTAGFQLLLYSLLILILPH